MTRMTILTALNEALQAILHGRQRDGIAMLKDLLDTLGLEEEHERNKRGMP